MWGCSRPSQPREAPVPLTQLQKRHLKSRAHHLKPVVLIGQHGLSAPVLREIELALQAHELIKVRVSAGDREERDAMIGSIASAAGAELIQRVGHMATFYRRNDKQPRIALPSG